LKTRWGENDDESTSPGNDAEELALGEFLPILADAAETSRCSANLRISSLLALLLEPLRTDLASSSLSASRRLFVGVTTAR